MASNDKIISLDEEQPSCYRIDLEGNYGWCPLTQRGSLKIIKFKSIDDALITRHRMGLPLDRIRLIDENRGRKVKLESWRIRKK